MSSTNSQSMQSGAALELSLRGTFQDKTHTTAKEVHPAVQHIFPKTSKYAIQTTYVEPQGTVSQFAGSTIRYCVPKCNGYLLTASLAGQVTAVTTTQADPAVIADTVCYKDDAWFMMLRNVRLELGCEQVHLKEEDGQIFYYKYNHHYNSDQRLGVLVNDGDIISRVEWARSRQNIRVPLLFDVFSHPSKALRIWTMEDSPVRFVVELRPMSELVEALGTANNGTGGLTAGFASGTIENLTLACEFLQIPVEDAQRLERSAPRRVTYVREWCRFRNHPHASTTAREAIDLAINNSMEQLVIFPKLDRHHVAPNLAVPANVPPNIFNYLHFSGEPTADGVGFVLKNPFAGAELWLDGHLRFAHSYEEMTTWYHTHTHPRNPTDKAERIAGFRVHHDPTSPYPGPSIQMAQVNQQKLYIYWTFNGVTETNWNGTIDVYAATLNVLVTDSRRARLVYP